VVRATAVPRPAKPARQNGDARARNRAARRVAERTRTARLHPDPARIEHSIRNVTPRGSRGRTSYAAPALPAAAPRWRVPP